MGYDEVVELITNYDTQVKALKKELFKMTWYMRGGVSIGEMYESSRSDRELMAEIIGENLQTTKESGQPFF